MKKFLIVCFVILTFNATVFANVENYVTTIIHDVSTALARKDLSEGDKIALSKKLLDQNLDVYTMSRNVLGQHYRQLTAEQQKSFVAAYKQYLINAYSSLVKKYKGQTAKIKHVKTVSGNSYIVQTLIEQGDMQPLKADYYITSVEGSYKVADVITEGISLIATQKAEFCDILSNQGFDRLLEVIKSKN